MKSEKQIQREIHNHLGSRGDCRIFRNNVGMAYLKRGDELVPIKFGLFPGSSDLMGWKSITITPDMVGNTIAVFLAVETKTDKNRPTKKQQNFIDQVNNAGGIAGVVRSIEDADELLEGKARSFFRS